MKYLAITPAQNEISFLPRLIRSVVEQQAAPSRWIIIDDGSTDGTNELIEQSARRYGWITPVFLPLRTTRRPGGESVVMAELNRIDWRAFDYLFRVDADITIEPDHTARLFHEFEQDPLLGIASGTSYEPFAGGWRPAAEPTFQAAGNCRIYKSECLVAIGGIESGLGWDTVDVTRALMLGFHTTNFRQLPFRHHRPMQTANGRARGRLNMGIAAYKAGYSPLFMAARALSHAFDPPLMMGGALMMAGYMHQWLVREPKLAEPALVKFVRRHQRRRLVGAQTIWR